MPKLYAASEICVYPSSSLEPFGLTLLESMASERPIVVTRTGGMPEIVHDNINGFLVPVKDFEELATRVTLLLTDKELRDRLSQTGRKIIEENYTKEIMTEKTLNIYKQFV